MTNIDRSEIEKLVRDILLNDHLDGKKEKRIIDESGVMSIKLPLFEVDESDRLDTGNSDHIVYTKDLVSLEESPRMGLGLMVMENTTFDWHLSYDEVDYIIEGSLSIIIDDRIISASAGELIFIPKNTNIKFSVDGHARFVYVTYPADWQE